MKHLWSLVAAASFVGCVVNTPIPAQPQGPQGPGPTGPMRTGGDGSGPTASTTAGSGTGTGCFAGQWKGGGDDVNHRHLGFAIQFVQEGAALHGTFDYTFELGKAGTETVSGTADCAAGTAELRGTTVTGDAAPAHYKLKLMPEVQGDADTGFEGEWDCDPCTPGTIKGYRRH